MTHRGTVGVVLLGLLLAAVGCSKMADPSPSPYLKEDGSGSSGGHPVSASQRSAAICPPVFAPACSATVPAFAASPASVEMSTGDPGIQMLIATDGALGQGRDLTSTATWTVEPKGIVAVEAGGYLRPLRAGRCEVRVQSGERKSAVPVLVGQGDSRAWDFGEDIVPVLTHSGCNTGGCHGKADGQNGFHLSLFGYDAEGDYRAITHDDGGRRVSRFSPERSLVLAKATGRVSHGGGMRIAANSPEYRRLAAWINAGAPERAGTVHGATTRLIVEPAEVRLDEPGPQQVRVFARFPDGSRRDVTRLANLRVLDDSVAKVNPNGLVTLLRRAETDLIVRYQSHVVSARVATVINPDLKFDFAKRAKRNFIDDELFERLESLRVPPSPSANDAAFLRRVTLDLTGEQPLPEQVRQYLADKDPGKRDKLVDRLLASREFVLFWRIKLGDMLQISSTRLGNGAHRYQAWVDECLLKNVPWDEMVRTMLTAVGKPEDNLDGGPVNYALDGPDAKTQAEQTAQRFLGVRLRCAQCHDHPFDVWTQDDYYGLAACFAKVQRTGGGMMGKALVKVDPKGQVEHPRTKKAAVPKLLGGSKVEVAEAEDPRKALAGWMTTPDNPYFARAMANWIWAQLFGKGIADPPDDLSRANPPVHPELLEALARHFQKHKFDLRDLIRTIAVSEAYGMSSGSVRGNEQDTRLFSHQIPRALSAHQMADALAQATGIANRFPNRPKQTRAIEVSDPATASTILDTFGRCPRANGCVSVSTPPLSLRQSLLLIGGDVISGKVAHLQGYLSSLLDEDLKTEPEDVVENLYYRTVCRPPSDEESSYWSSELRGAESLREAAEDLFWALLNSREFAFNH